MLQSDEEKRERQSVSTMCFRKVFERCIRESDRGRETVGD
jgi:hypothetical protein